MYEGPVNTIRMFQGLKYPFLHAGLRVRKQPELMHMSSRTRLQSHAAPDDFQVGSGSRRHWRCAQGTLCYANQSLFNSQGKAALFYEVTLRSCPRSLRLIQHALYRNPLEPRRWPNDPRFQDLVLRSDPQALLLSKQSHRCLHGRLLRGTGRCRVWPWSGFQNPPT